MWSSQRAKPPQAGNNSQNVPLHKQDSARGSSAHQLGFLFKEPGSHWEPNASSAANSCQCTVGQAALRCAQAQGAVLGARAQSGFAHSQTATRGTWQDPFS